MITRSSIDQVFEKLQEDPENCVCVDCNCPSPVFASISHGAFICSLCANQHFSLGSISEVKSLLTNDWTLDELRKIISGGNSALKEFTDYYGISEWPIESKYKTNAAVVYRKMLTEITFGRNFDEEMPSIESGKIIEEGDSNKTWYEEFYNKTKNIGNFALHSIDGITNIGKIKDSTEKLLRDIKIETIKDKTNDVFSSIAGSVKKNFEVLKNTRPFGVIKDETKNLFMNIEETIETNIAKAKNLVN